ncbi:hypothetical protein NDU88_001896 [Pleurodeles waltl]|uniref:Uncharacterized protein n=1 Tax=Pleurodeles waltl TaxID=8319 RepID=A0AAV7UU52_PLEWA|nr:hypothetical protein NDU88_001896 [Pleurodeles waltl]
MWSGTPARGDLGGTGTQAGSSAGLWGDIAEGAPEDATSVVRSAVGMGLIRQVHTQGCRNHWHSLACGAAGGGVLGSRAAGGGVLGSGAGGGGVLGSGDGGGGVLGSGDGGGGVLGSGAAGGSVLGSGAGCGGVLGSGYGGGGVLGSGDGGGSVLGSGAAGGGVLGSGDSGGGVLGSWNSGGLVRRADLPRLDGFTVPLPRLGWWHSCRHTPNCTPGSSFGG